MCVITKSPVRPLRQPNVKFNLDPSLALPLRSLPSVARPLAFHLSDLHLARDLRLPAGLLIEYLMTPVVRHLLPASDFVERPKAADAKTGLAIERTDINAWRFDCRLSSHNASLVDFHRHVRNKLAYENVPLTMKLAEHDIFAIQKHFRLPDVKGNPREGTW
ncbi:hypothetical protein F01_400076 [Burkholderia cenocepacia]|nr:hypothetical protein F01_400076 [Burkholderia cenocepacia]